MIPPPEIWDPPEGPFVFHGKNVPPADLSDPPAIFARKEVPPYYAQKMNTPPASWNPADWEADLWAYQVDGDGGLCQLSQYERF